VIGRDIEQRLPDECPVANRRIKPKFPEAPFQCIGDVAACRIGHP
jgi:hypothetical protein